MTTLSERPNTALLVVDVQNGVVGGAHDRDTVVANVGTLVGKAREADVPVVWVQHNDDENLLRGSDQWRIVPELEPDDAEPLVEKRYGDAFEDTTEDLTEWGAPPPDQVIAHTNMYWSNHRAPGRTAGTVNTGDVDFGSVASEPGGAAAA